MAVVTLSSKNQIVLPKEARQALGVKPGDKLMVTIHGGKVAIIERPAKFHLAIEGLMPGGYGPNYLKKERESWR